MFVFVHERAHHLRFDPANLATDDVIRQRIQGFWQIGRYRQQWVKDAGSSPRLLVGVSGVGGSQIIIASAEIDVDGWASTQPRPGRLYEVLLARAASLDAANLRGRPIRSDFALKFDRARYGHFRIFDADGFRHLQ